MLEFLRTYYGIQAKQSIPIRGIPSYAANNVHYVVIPTSEQREFLIEQAVVAYYLKEQNEVHGAYPLRNIDEQFVTTIDEEKWIVLQINALRHDRTQMHGEVLAQFHQKHQTYPFEPHSISSYGSWKKLWVDKLTAYEHNLQASLTENRTYFERSWIDLFPYVIGMTENAIQYIGEVERSHALDIGDRPTITFHRYVDQLEQACFFSYELHYDHPIRDVSECVRHALLQEEWNLEQVVYFIEQYERVQPLSPFSWQLLYARLLYPAHFFDQMDAHRNEEEQTIRKGLIDLCQRQEKYEQRLRKLFHEIKRNHQKIHIPMLQWM